MDLSPQEQRGDRIDPEDESSPLAVKNHVQRILRKPDVTNRAQALGKALTLGMINP